MLCEWWSCAPLPACSIAATGVKWYVKIVAAIQRIAAKSGASAKSGPTCQYEPATLGLQQEFCILLQYCLEVHKFNFCPNSYAWNFPVYSASIRLFSLSEEPRDCCIKNFLLYAMNDIAWNCWVFSSQFVTVLWKWSCNHHMRRLLVNCSIDCIVKSSRDLDLLIGG